MDKYVWKALVFNIDISIFGVELRLGPKAFFGDKNLWEKNSQARIYIVLRLVASLTFKSITCIKHERSKKHIH